MANFKLLAGVVAACLVLAGGAALYHFKTVGEMEKRLSAARAEAQAAKDAHNSFITELLRQTAAAYKASEIATQKALAQREKAHEEVRREGSNVIANITAQKPEPGGVDIDMPLPAALAADLVRLHETAAAAGRSARSQKHNPTGGNVSGKAHAGAANGHIDGTQALHLDGGAAGVVR